MNIQIKHRATEEVLLQGEAESIKDLINKNSRRLLCLSGADLSNCDFTGSDLIFSDFRYDVIDETTIFSKIKIKRNQLDIILKQMFDIEE